jgi:hypothetical protein
MIARVLMAGLILALTAPAALAQPVYGASDSDAARMGADGRRHLGSLRTPAGLPGWDEAAATAGCLAVASNLSPYLPDAATPQQVREEGEFWQWRLEALAPDEPVRIAYWEAAHGWLEEELKAMPLAEAQEFLLAYRGQCVIAQAAAESETMWMALQ